MKKKSFALIMALILMLALFLTACGTGADSGSPAPTGEPEGVASQPIPETEENRPVKAMMMREPLIPRLAVPRSMLYSFLRTQTHLL